MQEKQFRTIEEKVADCTATDQDLALFLYHLNSYNDETSRWESLDPELKASIKAAVKKEVMASIRTTHTPETKQPAKKLWTPFIAAASIILVTAFSIFYFYNHNDSVSDIVIANEISTGKQGATLTLANGKKIALTDATSGQLAKEAGVIITKTKEGHLVYEIKEGNSDSNEMNTLSTANGETYKIRLPDGSLVWLNAASSLTYAANLNTKGKRIVKLDGEAYFEVTKDKSRPFIVKSDGQTVEVLGTHFNVNSYKTNRSIKTTLLEGSVKVMGSGQEVLLSPQQQANLTNNQLNVNTVDPEEAISWKNGYFRFNDEKIQQVMEQIARWYNIEVVYKGTPTDEGFTGTISRTSNISDVLNMLERTKAINFDIEGRRVMVMK